MSFRVYSGMEQNKLNKFVVMYIDKSELRGVMANG